MREYKEGILHRIKAIVVAAVASASFLQGCATSRVVEEVPPSSSQAHVAFSKVSESARASEARGDLNRALNEWKIAATVLPGALEPPENIQRLNSIIQSNVSYYLSHAQNELSTSNHANAKTYLLNALSLTPDDPELVGKLKDVERALALQKLRTQPRKVNLSSPPGKGDQNLEQTFELALSLISTNKAKAKELFNYILKIDPNHLAARAYLELLDER